MTDDYDKLMVEISELRKELHMYLTIFNKVMLLFALGGIGIALGLIWVIILLNISCKC